MFTYVCVCVCVCVCVLITQPCLILCNSMDWDLPGSFVHRISKSRILEWVAIPVSRDLPKAGIEPGSPTLHSSLPEPLGKTHFSSCKALISYLFCTVFQYLESELLFCANKTNNLLIINNLYYKQRS